MHRYFLYFFILFCYASAAVAQKILISGRVMDASTGEPLPYVNVSVKNTTTGAISDESGVFSFSCFHNPHDSIQFRYVGYQSQSISVDRFINTKYTVELQPSNQTLPEVVIVPGENPAEVMLRKIIASKPLNNQEEFAYYSCEIYNKVRFDLKNFDAQLKERKLLQPFALVFENSDTSELTGEVYVPLFLSESLSDFYYRKNPLAQREIIRAVRVSGVENESFSAFLGNMYVQTNIYDNFIVLFEKNFISPIASGGLMYYRYYLTDSTFINNQWCYRIDFKPKRKQELTFNGHFWVHDSTWGIVSYEMEMAPDANINYVRYLKMSASYTQNDSLWVKEKEAFFVDFYTISANEKLPGFFGQKNTSYMKYSFVPPDAKIFNNAALVTLQTDISSENNDFWIHHRHDSLNTQDLFVYEMIDSVQQLRAYKTWSDIIQMIATGYYVGKYLEYGPYASMLSFNTIEGTRLRFGMRTSNEFSTKVMPYGHIAYGIKDEQFKYGAGIWYMFSKSPRRAFNMNYKYDYELLGKSENSFREDFLIGTLFSRNPVDNLTLTEQSNIQYEHEWMNGFSMTLFFSDKHLLASVNDAFLFQSGGVLKSVSVLKTTETGIQIRYAYKERFLSGEFERISLGSRYPIIRLRIFKGVSGYDYLKTSLQISHWFNLRGLGWSKYVIDAGIINGSIPYPFLKIHEGNESLMFDEMAFNMMNNYEFVSNRWVSLYYTHHFEGLFFNRIPLLRKMKFREVVWGKILFGNLDVQNQMYNIFPENMFILTQPYLETGAGIENIFKFFRIDLVWRHSYLSHPNIQQFGIMAGLQFYL